jgi:hypothetical protein
MDAEIVTAFELVLVFGALLALGFYELCSLRGRRSGEPPRRRDAEPPQRAE